MKAMFEEYHSKINTDVWDVAPTPKENSIVSSKWISNTNHQEDGIIENFKATFVTQRFSQKEGIDYEETFALV